MDERVRTGASARYIPLTTEMYNYRISAGYRAGGKDDKRKGNCCSGDSRDYSAVGVVCSLAICFLSA